MKKLLSILSLAAFTLLAACSPRFAINTDRDASVALNTYTSFRFATEDSYLTTKDPILDSRLNRNRISNFIKEELVQKGYQYAEEGYGLDVQFYTKVEDKQEVRNYTNPNPFFFYRWWGPWSDNSTIVRNYEESTLIVNLVDQQSGELVWQGWAIGEINYKSPKYREQLAKKVTQIFEEFPNQVPRPVLPSVP